MNDETNETQNSEGSEGPGETDQQEAQPEEIECPHCHESFLHRVGQHIKKAVEEVAEGAGDAIGEAKFGGES